MTTYRINAVYPCIQGEGCLTGTAMVLVRLQGCAVGCPWCDTPDARPFKGGVEQTAQEIVTAVRAHPGPRWVLVTGGEPAHYPLEELVEELTKAGYLVALETSGTERGHVGVPFNWVCVSPKWNMPGGRKIVPEALIGANEIKWLVSQRQDIERLEAFLQEYRLPSRVTICLQPISQQEEATQLCLRTVIERGWRLSVQVHKYLGLL